MKQYRNLVWSNQNWAESFGEKAMYKLTGNKIAMGIITKIKSTIYNLRSKEDYATTQPNTNAENMIRDYSRARDLNVKYKGVTLNDKEKKDLNEALLKHIIDNF